MEEMVSEFLENLLQIILQIKITSHEINLAAQALPKYAASRLPVKMRWGFQITTKFYVN